MRSGKVVAFHLVLVFDLDLYELSRHRAHCRIVTHHPGQLYFEWQLVATASAELVQWLYFLPIPRTLISAIVLSHLQTGHRYGKWGTLVVFGDCWRRHSIAATGNEENLPSNGNPYVIRNSTRGGSGGRIVKLRRFDGPFRHPPGQTSSAEYPVGEVNPQ